jgi:hypothetical protein
MSKDFVNSAYQVIDGVEIKCLECTLSINDITTLEIVGINKQSTRCPRCGTIFRFWEAEAID